MAEASKKILILRNHVDSSTPIDHASLSRVSGQSIGKVLKLLHPKYGTPSCYLYVQGRFFELQSAKPRKYASWFVNQRVVSDGQPLLASPIDPRFLLLPLLERADRPNVFQSIDEMLCIPAGCERLPLEHAGEWRLSDICDVQDFTVIRLNQDKVLSWLQRKVNVLAEALHRKRAVTRQSDNLASGFCIASNSSSGPSAATEVPTSVNREDHRMALQILAEYISITWLQRLLPLYSLTEADLYPLAGSNKRQAAWEQALEAEKENAHLTGSNGSMGIGGGDTKRSRTAPTKATTKDTKPPPGVKAITSFFAKKT